MALYSTRHSFLYKELECVKDFNPKILIRTMDKELNVHTNFRNLEPPFLLLSSSMPVIYAPNADVTRAKIAFGRWALPKLIKQIHHSDILIVMQALNSISDIVHDPEKGFEAIRIGLVDRLVDLMLHERDFIREKILMIFGTLAGLEAGRRVILKRYKILNNLALLLEDEVDAVRHKAQLVVELMSLSPVAATGLNCADYMVLLLRLIGGAPKTENDTILILHLATLKMLLDRDVKILALQHSAMDILMEKMNHPVEEVQMKALECIALLCHIPEGRAEAAKKDLGFRLCKKLFDTTMELRSKVAGTLAFATVQSDVRKQMSKKCTVERLVEVMENFQDFEGQLMAAKVLSNLSEDPKGKALARKMMGRIKNVITNNNDLLDRHKAILVNLLKKN